MSQTGTSGSEKLTFVDFLNIFSLQDSNLSLLDRHTVELKCGLGAGFFLSKLFLRVVIVQNPFQKTTFHSPAIAYKQNCSLPHPLTSVYCTAESFETLGKRYGDSLVAVN